MKDKFILTNTNEQIKSLSGEEASETKTLPISFKPEKKVTKKEVMKLPKKIDRDKAYDQLPHPDRNMLEKSALQHYKNGYNQAITDTKKKLNKLFEV